MVERSQPPRSISTQPIQHHAKKTKRKMTTVDGNRNRGEVSQRKPGDFPKNMENRKQVFGSIFIFENCFFHFAAPHFCAVDTVRRSSVLCSRRGSPSSRNATVSHRSFRQRYHHARHAMSQLPCQLPWQHHHSTAIEIASRPFVTELHGLDLDPSLNKIIGSGTLRKNGILLVRSSEGIFPAKKLASPATN